MQGALRFVGYCDMGQSLVSVEVMKEEVEANFAW
jgi:hypothetical protein